MAYRFTPMFIPGKNHVTADAFSRRSDSPISRLPSKASPEPSQAISNNVSPGYSDTFGPPNWVSSPSISAIIANMTITTPTAEEMYKADRLEEMVLGKVSLTLPPSNTTQMWRQSRGRNSRLRAWHHPCTSSYTGLSRVVCLMTAKTGTFSYRSSSSTGTPL